ncbi:hypothetical protein PHLCEN_2v12624, partial [Hermanssonia centrifuga]
GIVQKLCKVVLDYKDAHTKEPKGTTVRKFSERPLGLCLCGDLSDKYFAEGKLLKTPFCTVPSPGWL